MTHSQQLEDLFARGFTLAWFIHPDRDQAWEIASNALVQLETTVNRLQTYVDNSTPHHRTKVLLPREQVYQYLILRNAVALQTEELKCNPPLTEDTMLVYFYSFIAFRLFRLNSFRANACIARLLLRLPVEQARRLYEQLRPNYRDTDDSEYSREKQSLYEALKERFDGKVTPVTLARNEKSFAPHDDPGDLHRLVEECWERFSPWRGSQSVDQTIDVCLLVSQAPDQTQLEQALENESAEAEQNRMHIVMHCMQRFARMVLGEVPSMLIPQFVLATSGSDPGSSLDQRSSPPPLGLADYQRLISKLANARLRRRTTLEPLLQCKIDGQIKSEIDLRRESRSVPMILSAEDDCMEVWVNDVLLATYFLPEADELEAGRILEEAITLEGGQRLTFQCSLAASKEGEVTCKAWVRYRETRLSRRIARQWQRWANPEWWDNHLLPPEAVRNLLRAGVLASRKVGKFYTAFLLQRLQSIEYGLLQAAAILLLATALLLLVTSAHPMIQQPDTSESTKLLSSVENSWFARKPFGSFLEFSYATPQASLRDKDLSEAMPCFPLGGFVIVSPVNTLTALSTVRFFQNSTERPRSTPPPRDSPPRPAVRNDPFPAQSKINGKRTQNPPLPEEMHSSQYLVSDNSIRILKSDPMGE